MTNRKMENLQNLHVTFWLLKDCAWCSLWKQLGLVMIAPTIFVAIVIAWQSRRSLPDFIHNVSVCLWITANIIWMVGEFYYDDKTRGLAKIFFFAGLLVLAVYYLYESTQAYRRKGLSAPVSESR